MSDEITRFVRPSVFWFVIALVNLTCAFSYAIALQKCVAS
jgi:hypothetical protein